MVRIIIGILFLGILSCNEQREKIIIGSKEEPAENLSEFYVSLESKKEVKEKINSILSYERCNYDSKIEFKPIEKELEITDIIKIAKDAFERRCASFELSKITIAHYTWPLFVNSICQYDRARYVFCKSELEERFRYLKNNYDNRSFWHVSLSLLQENPMLGVISEAKPTLFIDGKTGDIISYIHKKSVAKKCEKLFPRKYKSPEIELYYAAAGGYLSRVKQLIKEGVNYNYKNTKSVCQYPLDCAKMSCQKEVVDVLMKAGAKEEGSYKNMEHCLH